MATAAKKIDTLATSTSPKALMTHATSASQKGGVGKSFWERAKIEFLRERDVPIAAYDMDGGTGSVARILGERDEDGELKPTEEQDPLKGVRSYNIHKNRGREAFADSSALEYKHIQIDTPGGGFDALSDIMDGGSNSLHGLYEAILKEGRKPIIEHIITPEDESVESVRRYLDATEGLPIQHIAILNMRDADEKSDFEMWFGYTDLETGEKVGGNARAEFLENGGIEIVMPKLAIGAALRMKRYNLTFTAASQDPRLTVTQRGQVSRWLREMWKELLGNKKFLEIYDI
ncbi:hypothetical protein [Agrobacterium pusense]|uniref:hypothetical protein n=1 Tax=Agrobacterium pusense TaxID=648995 RepID=UPI000D38EFC0|nr:hypothetical protein [Agrobacterium pusense]PTV70175.1 hypothetical protein DBL06_25260 [Agrobacterium pusense]